ncbi:MAG: ERF family protein [Nitratireductor sp.]
MTDTHIAVQDDSTMTPVPASESAAIFSLIERAARDPNMDIDKMQRLLDMKIQMDAASAQRAFFESMAAAQAEMPQVVRDADNDQTQSKFARYETISAAIQPIITKYGFSLTFSEGETTKPNCIRILCDVMHEAGHAKQYHADVPFDNVGMKGNPNKTNTHAYGSTKSYGKRYLKCDIFDVALKNEDDDGNVAGGQVIEAVSEKQLEILRRLIEETDSDIKKFCDLGGIAALPEMPANKFESAVRLLEQKKAKMQQRGSA